MTADIIPLRSEHILDSLHEGLYVTDTERTILYWSKAATRITGWVAADVVGRSCNDNILVHVDKDGRKLCGKEFCPLHRSICTNKSSTATLIVFGQLSNGSRLPMAVSVAPIHDKKGEVIGGVETFHDFSESYANLLRAKQIQSLAMGFDLPADDRIAFTSFYVPHDIIGGDFYAIRQLDSGPIRLLVRRCDGPRHCLGTLHHASELAVGASLPAAGQPGGVCPPAQ